jgi:hypothetical protein
MGYTTKGTGTVQLSLKETAGDEDKLKALGQKAVGRFYADFRRAKTINIFGSSREAPGYWKTTGRVHHQGKVVRFSPR